MTGLEVDARPFTYGFPTERTALVVIDMQRDFVEPGGFGASLGNDVAQLAPVVPRVAELLASARKAGLTVVHTREAHRSDLSDCPASKRDRGVPGMRIGDPGPMGRILIDGEPGADFVAGLEPATGEHSVVKPGKGAFHATGLEGWLTERGITHLLVAGVTTEVCVQSTLREANDRGYRCLLVEDCTESYFPEFRRATVEMVVAQGGIVGWAAPLAALQSALGCRGIHDRT
ncbi:cysteine hydrolase family protein [Spiribacter roseus]|uniref:cysteine hydrolase family protein n=1 Tax=Spiribacter roseus TaxID=1855875 RepID=UPI00132F8186|nr:cysteine hydrolase [Spiribacter roseus]